MKSKLQFILVLVFVALFQSANAQKGSKKPEIDMAKLMQHRSRILQKAAAQQQQQSADRGTLSPDTRPGGTSQGTNEPAIDKNNKQLNGKKIGED